MHFLNPLFLLASLSVIAPILFHLVRKEESRKVRFSSLMFVTRMPKKSLRRQHLKHLLLLFTRIVALCLLALAFSRPFFTSKLAAPIHTATDKSLVILIDNSFSMRLGDSFRKVQDEARKLVSHLGKGDSAQVVAFSDTTQVLNNARSEHALLDSLITSLKPTYRGTNHPQALKLANQLLAAAPNEVREIHWISDFQESGWNDSQGETSVGRNIAIHTHDVSSVESGNASVSQVQVNEIWKQDSSLAKVLARVSSYNLSAPGSGVLKLELNGKLIQEKPLSLPVNESQLIEFDPFNIPPGISTGRVSLSLADSLPEDNSFHFSLNSQSKMKLLLVADKGTRDSFYLAKALTASPASPFIVELQDPNAASGFDLTTYASILINNVETIPGKLSPKLHDFVNNGGGLVIVLGNRVRTADFNSQLGKILPAKLLARYGGKQQDKEVFISEVQRQHPIFSIFQGVHHTYFLTTPFSGFIQSTPAPSTSVLVRMENGSPLLMEGTVGKGRTLLFASALNMDWNDLPLKSVFLPFCHQMVKYSMKYEEGNHFFKVGEVVPLARLNPYLDKALNKISGTAGSFSQSWKVVKPSGEKADLNDSDLVQSPFFTLEEPGFYRTKVHNLNHVVAANIDPGESNLRKMEPQKMLASLRRGLEASSSAQRLESSLDQRLAWESKQSIWWYLLIVALLTLVVETYLANRYYKSLSDA